MIAPTARSFVGHLAELQFEASFNPYSDICPEHDRSDAPAIRRRNLELVLSAAISRGVDSLWVARDLGYRGGRRTGLAMTDDVCLAQHERMSSITGLQRPTLGPPLAERTASLIWHTLAAINRPVFLWNVFPLHPHEPGEPLSNRCHTKQERQECAPLLSWLVDVLQPRRLVAIGRDAEMALAEMGYPCRAVRHPSYGGQADFFRQSADIYDIQISPYRTSRKGTDEQLSFV